MNQTEQLRELEENAHKEKNNKLKYVLFQKAADGYVAEEEFELAHQLYEKALNTAQKIRNAKLECQTLIDLGSTAEKMDETDDAIEFYQHALEIALSRLDARSQSRLYTKLGIVFAKIRNYDLADRCFEQAKETANIARRAKRELMQEQTTPKLLAEPQARTGSRLHATPRRRTEVRNQVKQVEQISEVTRRLTLIVGILLLITLVIISTNIFFSQHGQVLGDVLVILLILIIIIILPFLNRIFAIIYHEKAQD